MTLLHLLEQAATDTPDRGYIPSNGRSESPPLTFAELHRKAAHVGQALRHLPRGSHALLLYPPGVDFIVGFFGALAGGLVPVPAYPPDPSRLARSMPRLLAMSEDAHAAVVLSTSMVRDLTTHLASETPIARLPWVTTDTFEGVDAPLRPAPDMAFVQYTSGSTGRPKGVRVTHESALANLHVIYDGGGLGGDDVYVGWTPLYHDMGLMMNMLGPMLLGCDSVVMSPLDFLGKPLNWLRTMHRVGASFSGGPNFAYALCVRHLQREALGDEVDLSRWRYAFVGAEPIRADTLDAFAEAFAPHGFRREALYPTFGLAENTLLVTGPDPGDPAVVRSFDLEGLEQGVARPPLGEDGVRLVSAGQVRGDQRVAIVAPETHDRLADRRVGEIWVQGPCVGHDYFEKPDETARVLRAVLPGHPGTWLRTGDLGFLDGGELFPVARQKDLIVVRGRNVHPHDVEAAAEAHPALRPGCSAAYAVDRDGTEGVGLACEVRAPDNLDVDALAAALATAVAQAVGVGLDELALLRPRTLPKTSSGKLQRRAAGRGVATGDLEPLVVLAGDDLARAWLAARTQDVDELDSLARIALAQEAEQVLGRPVDDRVALGVGHVEATAPSWCQRAMWSDRALGPEVHVNHVAFHVRGTLSSRDVHEAVARLAATFPSLRTRFTERDGVLHRLVGDRPRGRVCIESIEAESFDDRIRELARQGLDPEHEVFGLHVLRVDADTQIVVFSLHHMIYDATWVARLGLALLRALDGQPLVRQPTDYRRLIAAEVDSEQIDVVRSLVGDHPGLTRPRNGPRRDATTTHTARAGLLSRWEARARDAGVTPFEWLAGAYSRALGELFETDDVLFHTSVSLRDLPGTGDVDGPAFNALPMRLQRVDDAVGAAHAARDAKARIWPHRAVPVLRTRPPTGHASALGPVMLHLYDWRRFPTVARRLRAGEEVSLQRLSVRLRPLAALTVPRPFDLSVGVAVDDGRVHLGARHEPGVAPPDRVRELLERMEQYVDGH